ncbi:hypothetical protein PV08_06725 [Exophiala spinifera]|uniref:Uncharacterized protein n=1 Tax=Exophiala spinifera TaxID=91928 RepID=A0A0D2BRU8_9EURO|nr:uncharacterized protein PV08_06725 [Exophiala spinifera]KIW13944.1 hypothetical protein PV08_06725 [Exophiala spinifera]
MCVRTKTTYGCGCEFKTTNECNDPHCSHLERWKFPREGDCKICKEGGQAVTRGREGKGRYAQQLNRRHHQEGREPSCDPVPEDIGGGVSPWAAPLKREKEWHSPSRKMADDAWLQEHAERNSDLQTLRESMSAHSDSDRASTAILSPPSRGRRVYEVEEEDDYCTVDRDADYNHRHRRQPAPRSLQIEIRSVHNDQPRRTSSRHASRHRRRHDSQESFQSVHSGQSSSRRYKPAPTSYTTHDIYETHDSGYGSYGSRTSHHGYEIAKTEPYTYSPAPRVVTIKAPSSSYQTGYGIPPHHGSHPSHPQGINVVTRSPMYTYSSQRY